MTRPAQVPPPAPSTGASGPGATITSDAFLAGLTVGVVVLTVQHRRHPARHHVVASAALPALD